jgi:hypothetical protein
MWWPELMTRKIAAILTIAGGIFYILGGALGLGGVFEGIFRIGLIAGPIIMIGGALVSSRVRNVRMAGVALAIVGVMFAGIYWCGGLIAGPILILMGSIYGLRYKESIPVQETLPNKATQQVGV